MKLLYMSTLWKSNWLNNKDADTMSRYPYKRVTEADKRKIDNKTVKTICSSIKMYVEDVTEELPTASISVIEATESPGRTIIVQREKKGIGKTQREIQY